MALYLSSLQQAYEKEFHKKLADSNAQVQTKRKGGHVEVIKPTPVFSEIPFLTSEEKVLQLQRYLETTEPHIVVPKSYIRNTLSRS